jgi:DNA phosphorothioation-dependent restriction protein DptH
MAVWIEERMAKEIRSLPANSRECRAVFSAPPKPLLREVFDSLAGDGRLLKAETIDHSEINYPVVLQVESILPDQVNLKADIKKSGLSTFNGLAGLRNNPDCGIFLTLVVPGAQVSDTHASTRKLFGVADAANQGGASIEVWWNDPFVKYLASHGIGDVEVSELDQALLLLKESIVAADIADQHVVSRFNAWRVIQRLWDLQGSNLALGDRISLAAGFPPSEDGTISTDRKKAILSALVEKFETASTGVLITRAKDYQERVHLEAFIKQFRRKCEAITALKDSMPFYYAPDDIDPMPDWWKGLTLQRWEALLEEDSTSADIEIFCANPIAIQGKGIVDIVQTFPRLRVEINSPHEPTDLQVRISRQIPGKPNDKNEWFFQATQSFEFEDDSIPMHKVPIKYAAELVGVPNSTNTTKLISLANWEPGLIVCSRTVDKVRVPKLLLGKPIETSLELSSAGRTYLDIYSRPGVEVLSDQARGFGGDDEVEPTRIGRVTDNVYGMEVEVEAGIERVYKFEIRRPEILTKDTFHILLSAEESSAEECKSFFEFHLAANARRGGRSPKTVLADNQARSSQLQGWMLDAGRVERSFYPYVLAPDYASEWRRREWISQHDTIFSAGRFLNDPRPTIEEMRPPSTLVEARKKIAEKVRGKDGTDLIESANLGFLLATDKEFESEVDRYIRAYLEWLSTSPTEACWCDIGLVMGLESDRETLEQVPIAVIVSPLHPIRFAWHCLAQRSMYLAARKHPCPAASILDPDCVPDSIVLPLRDATGGLNQVVYFSVECSSDYWGILWNTNRLDRLINFGDTAPLDREMGLLVGGISSGFNVSQVHRAMNDVSEMLVAKPAINVLVSSAAGANNSCNEGLLSWGRQKFSNELDERDSSLAIGVSEVHIYDERPEKIRPDDAEISNLTEDTSNALLWYSAPATTNSHDLAIIAQLETSNAAAAKTSLRSPLALGGLFRARIRKQEKAGSGQFLCESRVAERANISGDGIADNTANAISRLEGWGSESHGYVFAPSVNAVKRSMDKAKFVAVSSSSVDPACFLGSWLENTYLWDYELPSYSSRAGDSNGYYLLSKIDKIEIQTLGDVLKRLPDCGELSENDLSAIIQEVARRGIPTIRGLSSGDLGAIGDLGLFIATRLLQDSFRLTGDSTSMLQPWSEINDEAHIALVIPVDPFQRYLNDLGTALRKPTLQRPDLVVICLVISDSAVRCRVTPIEVKNRKGDLPMSASLRQEALEQAKSLSALLELLQGTYSDDQEMMLWRLAYQNLLVKMIEYGFRVYSQQLAETGRASEWASLQARALDAILASELVVEVNANGRLIVIDGSATSGPKDTDLDGFDETIELSQMDASRIVRGQASDLYAKVTSTMGDWKLFPSNTASASSKNSSGLSATQSNNSNQDEQPVPASSNGLKAIPKQIESNTLESEHVEVDQLGLDLKVGRTLIGFETVARHLNLGHTSLNHMNMGVVGDLGTGKTQLLKSLVYQISQGASGNRGFKPNVLIFDYKKDYSSDDFVKATGAKVIKPEQIPLNLFDLSGSSQTINPWLDRYRFFADVLDKIYPGIGPVQRDRLKRAIRDGYTQSVGPDFPTIYNVYQNYLAALRGGADSLSSILGDIVDLELFAEDRSAFLRADKFFEGVVVISLNELGQDDRTKNMLVATMLNVFYERMLKIPKRPFLGKNRDMRVVDSMLLVDEADNIMKYEFDVLRKILLQGREFGVGVILASQYLSHFKAGGTDYREMLLTWFLHKVPNVSAKDLGLLGLTDLSALQQMAERIKSLGLHECLYKTHAVHGEFLRGQPFFELQYKPMDL